MKYKNKLFDCFSKLYHMFAHKTQWFDLTFAWIVLRLTKCMSQGMDDTSGEKVFINSGTPESAFAVI